jgi:hypothetical protein
MADRRERQLERQAAAADPDALVRDHYAQIDVACGDGGLSHRLDSPRPLTWRDRLEIPYDSPAPPDTPPSPPSWPPPATRNSPPASPNASGNAYASPPTCWVSRRSSVAA